MKALAIVLPLLIGGCTITDKIDVPALDVYTRSDIDAITAQAACKQMARTLVQIARCGDNRRP